ncbi:hypothetical protein BK666_08945 [Pseudomonas frederiksbergensis]|uniref:Uncharacterized protein n=1 Tax=Pseudomonas frederiksbergensis TaxID=104087 RepID=A0A423K9H9_9PSED|nr:hypothetical protein [Pseudomonas frederiksbergensis]RON48541.1 hypothetical protein BK666_08945 [Pseudomonas frederiksbergensis]
MQSVTYRADLSPCTPLKYQQDIEKYAGNIECSECEARAWFVRGSLGGVREKAACFAAHHEDGCQIKTVILVIDGEDAGPSDGADTAQIVVDLNKRSSQTIMAPEPSNKPPVYSPWGSLQKKYANASDYPINKSLRQILSHLIRNPNYPEDDATIKVVTDGGRVALEGSIRSLLSSQHQLSNIELGSVRLFWGLITNVNRRNGLVWLNCGDYLTEPSLLVSDENLEEEMLSAFKLHDMNELAGARFIVIGWLSGSEKKPIINFGFAKYIAFVKYRIKDEEEQEK